MTPINYDLNKTGRIKINKKIYNTDFWKKNKNLQPEDLLGMVDHLIKINLGIENLDDIDTLKNKRIKMVGELIQNHTNKITKEFERILKEKLKKFKKVLTLTKKIFKIQQIINGYIITNLFKKFFTVNRLSQILQETNPLSEISQKRRISSVGLKIKTKNNVKLIIREIHSSHYGKICPIETNEGKNAGLILTLAKDSQLNQYGYIENPFFKIIKTKLKKKLGKFFLSTEQEKNLILAPGDLLIKSKEKEFIVKKNEEFVSKKLNKINYINTSTNQMLSIGTGLIPFLEHDDANRALMGSKMQQQAIPLKKPERPIVKTETEKQITINSESSIIAKESGIITFINSKKIILYNKKVKKNKIKNINESFFKKIKKIIKKKNRHEFLTFKNKTYLLDEEKKSNENTKITQKIIINKKQWIRKGQILNDGNATNKGELAIGKNILIGYMSWEGYNFEDAIIISERLVNENILTSQHIKKYKTFLINYDLKKEKITKNIPMIKLKNIKKLKKNGIIKKGVFVENEDIILGKIKIIKEERKINKILNTLFEKKLKKNTSIKLPKNIKGNIYKTKILKKKSIYCINIYINEKRKIKVGDKIAGRHGNKGVISKILSIDNMPYLLDGTPIDILLNPLGIPSRMNVGQIFECLLSLAGKHLKEHYSIIPFKNLKKTSENIIFNKLNEARKKTKKNWIFNPNYPGKTKIFDGKTGKVFKQPINIGYAYIIKLIHLVEDKITARLIGPYSLTSKQPLKGKAKNGGQRFGEMEIWALEGFNAAYTLQEILTIKSDDLKNRSKLLTKLIKGKSIPKPNISESLKILIIEMQAICLDIKYYNKNIENFF